MFVCGDVKTELFKHKSSVRRRHGIGQTLKDEIHLLDNALEKHEDSSRKAI